MPPFLLSPQPYTACVISMNSFPYIYMHKGQFLLPPNPTLI
jgi:hypothetical protein